MAALNGNFARNRSEKMNDFLQKREQIKKTAFDQYSVEQSAGGMRELALLASDNKDNSWRLSFDRCMKIGRAKAE